MESGDSEMLGREDGDEKLETSEVLKDRDHVNYIPDLSGPETSPASKLEYLSNAFILIFD